MNITPWLKTVYQTLNFVAPRMSLRSVTSMMNHRINHMSNKQYSTVLSNTCTNRGSLNLLQPSVPMYNLVCGMKIVGKPHLRCRGCYFVWRDNRKFVMCKTHPRHKQAQVKRKEYNTWILTHATQSPKRPW